MDEQLLSLFRIIARIFTFAAPNIIMILYVNRLILGAKRSMGWAYGWFLGKLVFHALLFQWILGYYYSDSRWWIIMNGVIICVTAVINFLVCFFVYDADYLKIAVVTALGELPWAFLIYFCIGIVNLLEGKDDIWAYGVEFQPLDMLIPVLEFGIVFAVCRVLGPSFKKIREHRIVHRRTLCILIGVYIFCASISGIQAAKTARSACAIISACSLGALFGVIALIYRYTGRLKREQEFLNVRQRLGQTHYETIQRQIRQMEHSQQVIDGQMEKIRQMEETENFDSEVVASYLEQIRDAHEEIRAGIYCDNWMIDALLYSQTSLFEKEGKELICSMQGYTEGKVPEEDMVQILTLLLEYAKRADAGKEIILNVTTVGSQTVAELVTAGEGKVRLLKRKLKPYLKKYDGTLLHQQEDEKYRIVATF